MQVFLTPIYERILNAGTNCVGVMEDNNLKLSFYDDEKHEASWKFTGIKFQALFIARMLFLQRTKRDLVRSTSYKIQLVFLRRNLISFWSSINIYHVPYSNNVIFIRSHEIKSIKYGFVYSHVRFMIHNKFLLKND